MQGIQKWNCFTHWLSEFEHKMRFAFGKILNMYYYVHSQKHVLDYYVSIAILLFIKHFAMINFRKAKFSTILRL